MYAYVSRIFNKSLVTLTISQSMQFLSTPRLRKLVDSALYKEIILVIGVGRGSHVFR